MHSIELTKGTTEAVPIRECTDKPVCTMKVEDGFCIVGNCECSCNAAISVCIVLLHVGGVRSSWHGLSGCWDSRAG